MTDANAAGAVTAAAEAVTALRETLEKFVVPDKDESDSAPPPTEAETAAAWARKKYDGLLKWVLGIFAGIGLLIFGSVPFAGLTGVDFAPLGIVGLALVGSGLGLVIWAATIGLEPQDSSLGELSETLRKLNPTKSRFYWWFLPRGRANAQLREILGSKEREAHLGPGIESVDALIGRIGELEKLALKEDPSWGEGGPPVAMTLLPASPGGHSPEIVMAPRATEAQLRAQLTASLETIGALQKLLDKATPAQKTTIAAVIRVELDRFNQIRDLLPTTEDLAKAGGTATLTKTLERYLQHRALLLDESAVAQLRGTFALVRRMVFAGALLTLVGGVLYTYMLSNPATAGVNSLVLISVKDGSAAQEAIKGCDAGTAEKPIHALLLTSTDADGLQNGPFTAVTTEPGCEGIPLAVGEGEGHYAAAPPTSEPPTTQVTDDVEPAQLVSVSLFQNTPAWREAAECLRENPIGDLTGLVALLTSANEDDGNADGPFTVETADLRCSGISIEVADGDGTYEPLR